MSKPTVRPPEAALKASLDATKESVDRQSIQGVNLNTLVTASPACSYDSVRVEVFFRDLERELISLIQQSYAVAGCLAWLTNPRILKALSEKEHVLIMVQKEDFLRPDVLEGGSRSGWEKELHHGYSQLRGGNRIHWGDRVSMLSMMDTPNPSIRCVGVHHDALNTIPRMHNKFLVCFKERPRVQLGPDENTPWSPNALCMGWTIGGKQWFDAIAEDGAAVWTGSYNPSVVSSRSLENAVVLHSKEVARTYFAEFEQIVALSEPLDWSERTVCPTYETTVF